MMDGLFKAFAQYARMFAVHAGDEDALFVSENALGNFDDLRGRFSSAEYDFRKTFAQSPMGVHLREAKVGRRRGLKSAQDMVAADAACPEFFKEPGRFRRGHARTIPGKSSNLNTQAAGEHQAFKPQNRWSEIEDENDLYQSLLTSAATNILVMMMAEKAMAILEQVPDDEDVQREDADNNEWMTAMALLWTMDQLVDFDGDKKR